MNTTLSLERCRDLLGTGAEEMSDEQVLELRDFLATLGGVIIDAFTDLENLDHTEFYPHMTLSEPPGDPI